VYKNIPSKELYSKISEWLDTYHSTESTQKKAKMKTYIVANMIPVVKKLARTIARRATDPIEDLVQAGSIGLLKAIERYDKEKNDNFKVYAGYFIIGEMKHFIRDKMSTIHVPRHIQELCIRINNFTNALTYEELQTLTSDEVASALEVPKDAVDFALMADRRRSIISLDDSVYSVNHDSAKFEEIIAAFDYKEQAAIEDARIIFENIIEYLPADEQVVIDMYYNQDMNQSEIAEALQLTKMAVFRRMKSAFNIIAALVAENSQKRIDMLEAIRKRGIDDGFSAL